MSMAPMLLSSALPFAPGLPMMREDQPDLCVKGPWSRSPHGRAASNASAPSGACA
jgi:hypothetical protein